VGQPREHFDKDRLLALGKSMIVGGQQIPVILIAIKGDPDHDYQLYDGERRWQAANLVGKPTLKAIITTRVSEAKLFKGSAIANVCHESHTPMEIARTLARVKEEEDLTIAELVDIFGLSSSYVSQHLGLNKLHPQVQAMMHPDLPDQSRMSVSVAVEVGRLQQDNQPVAAVHIQRKGMKLSQVRHYIRQLTQKLGVSNPGRIRKPNDDFRILSTFLIHADIRVGQFLDLSAGWSLADLFTHREGAQADEVVRSLGSLIERLGKMSKIVSKAVTKD